MRDRFVVHILLIAVLSFLGGCSGPDRPAWLSVNPNNWANRAQTDEPIYLDVAGPVMVDVESFNGDVVMQGNPELTRAKVTILRESVHGHGRSKEGAASLGDITSSAEIVPGALGQALQVRTSTTSAEPHFQRAHVYIELPEIENVRVKTSNGRVWARNIRGAVDITTSEKDVRVMTNQPMSRPVTIINRNGDIDYRIRAESQGKIDAETVNGKAIVFARYGRLVVQSASSKEVYRGVLNGGANPITLRTVNGDIRVAVVHNPELVDVHLPE